MRSPAISLSFTLVLAACSNPLTSNALVGETDSSSCDLRTASSPEQMCTDYTSVGVGQSAFKSTCEAKKGTVGTACSRAGALGGCSRKNTDGQDNDETRWYFPADDVKTADDVARRSRARRSLRVARHGAVRSSRVRGPVRDNASPSRH